MKSTFFKSKTFLFILFVLFTGAATTVYTTFDGIRIKKNPAIILPNGDTISNYSAGLVDMKGSKVTAKAYVSDSIRTASIRADSIRVANLLGDSLKIKYLLPDSIYCNGLLINQNGILTPNYYLSSVISLNTDGGSMYASTPNTGSFIVDGGGQTNLIVDSLNGVYPQQFITMKAATLTPQLEALTLKMYIKESFLIWYTNIGGSDAYFYIDLSQTMGQQVEYSVTEPTNGD